MSELLRSPDKFFAVLGNSGIVFIIILCLYTIIMFFYFKKGRSSRMLNILWGVVGLMFFVGATICLYQTADALIFRASNRHDQPTEFLCSCLAAAIVPFFTSTALCMLMTLANCATMLLDAGEKMTGGYKEKKPIG